MNHWHFNSKSFQKKDRETGNIPVTSSSNVNRRVEKRQDSERRNEKRERHRDEHGNKGKDRKPRGAWVRDLTEEGVEPNPGPQWCRECDLARTKDGKLQDECNHHNHQKRMSQAEGKEEKKEAKTGAERRILEKYTEPCKRGVNCTNTTHYHTDEETGEATVRLGNPSHKTMIVVPSELKTVKGLIDWTCLIELEKHHYTGRGFDLHQNEHARGEIHHKCATCIRHVVRLSGSHRAPRNERPCYACLGLDPPSWYVLSRELTSEIPEEEDDYEENSESEAESGPAEPPRLIPASNKGKEPQLTFAQKQSLKSASVVEPAAGVPDVQPSVSSPAPPKATVSLPANSGNNPKTMFKGDGKPTSSETSPEDIQNNPPPVADNPEEQSEDETENDEEIEGNPEELPENPDERPEADEQIDEAVDGENLFVALIICLFGQAFYDMMLMIFNPVYRRAPTCLQNVLRLPLFNDVLYRTTIRGIIYTVEMSRAIKPIGFLLYWVYVTLSYLILHAGSFFFMLVSLGTFFLGTLLIIPISFFKFIFTPAESPPEPVLVFTIPETQPKLPDFYRWFYTTVQLIVPICSMWYCLDVGIWPSFCVLMTDHVAPRLGTSAAAVFGFAVFQSENLFAALYVWLVYKVYRFVNSCFVVRRKHMLYDNPVVSVNPRPKKSSFNKVEYEMDIKDDRIYQVYAFEIAPLGIGFEYFSAKIADRKVSGTLFYDEGAVDSGRLGDAEFMASIQKLAEKSGHINWDRNFMTTHKVIWNTTQLLRDHHKLVKEDETLTPMARFNFELFGDSPMRPWWTKGIGNILITTMTALLFVGSMSYLAYQAMALVYMIAILSFEILSHVSVPILGFTNFMFALGLPGAEAFQVTEGRIETFVEGELAIGTYGYRVYDNITGRYEGGEFLPMKTNDVNENKGLEFYLDPRSHDSRTLERKVMGALSPYAIPGIAMPKVDLRCPLSYWCGIIHRGAGKTPEVDADLLNDKAAYALEMIEALVPAAAEDEIMTTEEALDTTSYSQARKQEIKDMEDEAHEFDETAVNVTAPFGKDEPYSEPGKHERTIQGAHALLWTKGLFGSLSRHVKTMEHVFYDCFPSNIKMMNPVDQLLRLLGLGPGTKTVNDFSSYEASFSRLVQESAQFVAYDYFFKNTSYSERVPDFARRVLGGSTTMKNKHGTAKIRNLKCSGAPDTSFSNWFDNVCTICHIFWVKFGVHWTDCLEWIICEGDDNITDDHGFELTNKDFEPYGLTAKIENNLDLGEAGFCQRFVNIETGNLTMDPIRYLGRVQYIPIEYIGSKKNKKLMMLKAKAMSTLAFCPNGPVVSEHAWRILELTKSLGVSKVALKKMAKYGQNVEDFTNFKKPQITESDRQMVAQVFGFSIEQQKRVSETLEAWKGGPLHLPPTWFPDTWVQYYDEYSTTTTKESTYAGWGNDAFFDYFSERVGEVTKV